MRVFAPAPGTIDIFGHYSDNGVRGNELFMPWKTQNFCFDVSTQATR